MKIMISSACTGRYNRHTVVCRCKEILHFQGGVQGHEDQGREKEKGDNTIVTIWQPVYGPEWTDGGPIFRGIDRALQ
jgi:hypothetical protein